MPDHRKNRGPHPADTALFALDCLPMLREAGDDYAWLLTRGYGASASLTLVGDHFQLAARQRLALMRSVCSDTARATRLESETDWACIADQRVGIDGYNLLITLEAALSGGMVLIGRDGAYRDLASVHGTYRKVEQTEVAVDLMIDGLATGQAQRVDLYLDRPVSNSGRLKTLIADRLEACTSTKPADPTWNIDLVNSPDELLRRYSGIVVTTDGGILDHGGRWINLARRIITRHIPDAWLVTL